MNRRTFFESLAGRDKAAGTATLSKIDGAPLQPFISTTGDPWDYRKAAHLLRRAMSGPTDAEIRQAVSDGLNATVEKLLLGFDPPLELISYFAGKEPNTGPPEHEGPRYDDWVWGKLSRRMRLIQWWPYVMATSPVSLQERMVFFWHDHFTTDLGKVEFAEFSYVNNRLLRGYAFGNFKDLVKEVSKDPAMIAYLDLELNTKFSLNENYARELLELFTCGRVDREGTPNYTQTDVREAARALTGWARIRSAEKGDSYHALESYFWVHLWDDTDKTFLGETGNWKLDDIIEILFEKRGDQIAWFICEKLYHHFVSLKTDEKAVEALADLFRRADWEITPVLRALFRSRHFFDLENIGCKPKDLLEFYIGMIRGMGLQHIPDFIPNADLIPYRDLFFRLEAYGMMPFHPPNVSGWPKGRDWVTPAALVPRMKFARDVARGSVEPWFFSPVSDLYRFDPLDLVRSLPDPSDLRSLVDDLALYLLGVEPSEEEREMLFLAALDGGAEYEWSLENPDQRPELRIRRLLEAVFELPKFQLY